MSRATSRPGTVRRRRTFSPWDLGAGTVLAVVILTVVEPQVLATIWHLVLEGSVGVGRLDRSVLHAPVKSFEPFEFGMAPIGGMLLADRVNDWSRTPLKTSGRHGLVGWGVLWSVAMLPLFTVCALTDSWPLVWLVSVTWIPFLVYELGRVQHRRRGNRRSATDA